RGVRWRQDAPAQLFWAEARHGPGGPGGGQLGDELFVLDAPFQGPPTPWLALDARFSRVFWAHENLALVTAYGLAGEGEQRWLVDPARPGNARPWPGRGEPLTRVAADGAELLRLD